MTGNDKPILIYTTFPTVADAERVGSDLVDRGLAACVNIAEPMTSIYVWQGQRHRDRETAMLIKTRAGLKQCVIAETIRQHPHDNPAVLVLATDGGSDAFAAWIAAQTRDQSSQDRN